MHSADAEDAMAERAVGGGVAVNVVDGSPFSETRRGHINSPDRGCRAESRLGEPKAVATEA